MRIIYELCDYVVSSPSENTSNERLAIERKWLLNPAEYNSVVKIA